jgi:hypothetical protein
MLPPRTILAAEVTGVIYHMTTKRVLVVGLEKFRHCESVPWTRVQRGLLPDYDVVILHFPSLYDVAGSISYKEHLAHMNNELLRLLQSKGGVLILAGAPTPLQLPGVLMNSWADVFPNLGIVAVAESGSSIQKSGDGGGPIFNRYLARLRQWSFHFGRNTNIGVVPFLTNREGKLLAARFADGLSVLPVLPDLTHEQQATAVISGMIDQDLSDKAEAPEWAAQLHVPGVAEIDERLVLLRGQIAAAQSSIAELTATRSKLTEYRALAYATGDELEEIVRRVARHLGADVTGAVYTDEDAVMKWRDAECIVEVKGLTGDLGLDPVRQLMDWNLRAETIAGRRFKSVLFVNTHRLKGPADRPPVKYPANVAQRAAELGISVVNTAELFQVLAKVLAREVTGADVLDRIVSANGHAALLN